MKVLRLKISTVSLGLGIFKMSCVTLMTSISSDSVLHEATCDGKVCANRFSRFSLDFSLVRLRLFENNQHMRQDDSCSLLPSLHMLSVSGCGFAQGVGSNELCMFVLLHSRTAVICFKVKAIRCIASDWKEG